MAQKGPTPGSKGTGREPDISNRMSGAMGSTACNLRQRSIDSNDDIEPAALRVWVIPQRHPAGANFRQHLQRTSVQFGTIGTLAGITGWPSKAPAQSFTTFGSPGNVANDAPHHEESRERPDPS